MLQVEIKLRIFLVLKIVKSLVFRKVLHEEGVEQSKWTGSVVTYPCLAYLACHPYHHLLEQELEVLG